MAGLCVQSSWSYSLDLHNINARAAINIWQYTSIKWLRQKTKQYYNAWGHNYATRHVKRWTGLTAYLTKPFHLHWLDPTLMKQWYLNFVFLKSLLLLILYTFWLVLPKFLQQQFYIFLECTRGDPKISRIVTKNLFKIFVQVWIFSPLQSTVFFDR